jgi:hypothetical protein
MGDGRFEQLPENEEVFPTEYLFEAADRLKGLKWGRLLYPTVLHIPYQKERIHTDVVDPESSLIYHLSTHPNFLDLPKNTPEDLIPGYGNSSNKIASPIISLTDRQTQSPTHLLIPNFEPLYYWPFGYGLKYGLWSGDEVREGTPDQQRQFKDLFERLAPLE